MDLAARNGIKVVVGEISNTAPEWMGELYPDGHKVSSNHSVSYPSMNPSSVTGGVGMCLDKEDVLHAAEKFQTALIERYRDHPALLAYDLWNEMHPYECYCEATQEKFRESLKKKYGSLEALGRAWHSYSMARWEFVRPPRSRSGGYADAMDWMEFTSDNKNRLLQRRVELFRSLDKKLEIGIFPPRPNPLPQGERRILQETIEILGVLTEWDFLLLVGFYLRF